MKPFPVPQNAPAHIRASLVMGCLFGASGVVLGAVSAHLPSQFYAVPTGPNILHNAVEMLMWHALALLGISGAYPFLSPRLGRLASYAFISGTLLFVLPVMLFAFKDAHIASMSVARIAPYGGTLLILAWLLTGIAAIKRRKFH
ncbi:hypothetical protein AA106555_0241 [Neokomagataea thailandica NBRC 106555]|uniref:DUF423 domain-containing protein n=2 Tax=Neokomagataea TaxID=1223423 RepID=A0A4Y6V6M8_9PROT|nr:MULTISPECIES: DUF423 domain-containing protein [Neokomagataea]QDH24147.1 DUF423 domain-containing protein [Neokomagataea tanensis]GBR50518.1 hypothetical protein AA106555_0241 [Neokomagataea thailandica NBRC 106555]